MRIHDRFLVGAVVVGVICGVVTPARAGSTWGPSQIVSPTTGTSIQLSEYGDGAAWITTSGAVRTSRYLPSGAGWTTPKAIPTTTGAKALRLSANGSTALVEVPGSGLLLAQRTGAAWNSPITLVSGAQLTGAQMSRDARVVTWVDWSGITAKVRSIVRAEDGTWSAPVTVGTVLAGPASQARTPMVLSRNGSTVVWLDETAKLHSARLLSGVWQAPDTIAQLSPAGLEQLAVERDGNDVVWMVAGDDTLYFSEYEAGWQPAEVLTAADPSVVAVAPNARAVGFVDEAGYFDLMSRTATGWTTAFHRKLAGKVQIAAANSAVATTQKRNGRSVLRVYALSKGKWQPAVKLSAKAKRPALSSDGNTVAWVSGKRIYAAKR